MRRTRCPAEDASRSRPVSVTTRWSSPSTTPDAASRRSISGTSSTPSSRRKARSTGWVSGSASPSESSRPPPAASWWRATSAGARRFAYDCRHARPRPRGSPSMGESATILLIEDEPRLRHNLQVLLEGEGYRVTTAQNGAEGIKKATEQTYDLVITDIVMPEVNGFQVMDHMKAHMPDTVVLAITGFVSTESAVQALAQGGSHDLYTPLCIG